MYGRAGIAAAYSWSFINKLVFCEMKISIAACYLVSAIGQNPNTIYSDDNEN